MIRVFKMIVELIAWLNIFIVPSAILGVTGYIIYHNNNGVLGTVIFILFVLIGIALGIFAAEKVRRTIGCSSLIFRVFTSYDITKWSSNSSDNDNKDGK